MTHKIKINNIPLKSRYIKYIDLVKECRPGTRDKYYFGVRMISYDSVDFIKFYFSSKELAETIRNKAMQDWDDEPEYELPDYEELQVILSAMRRDKQPVSNLNSWEKHNTKR